MSKGASVQALYELCKRTFTSENTVSPQAIRKLCSILDTISPLDVGLKENYSEDDRGLGFFGGNFLGNYSNRVGRWSQPITYLDIYDGGCFTIGIFCLPTSSVIPLHDHPGMTVLSKVLYGSMHVKAYDWVEPAIVQSIGAADYSPAGGNMLKGDKEEDHAWIVNIETPDDLYILPGKYEGPKVQI